jgi:EAL domain-containing protein (putative c-di-GMP-specific phosphodiesterase class I)
MIALPESVRAMVPDPFPDFADSLHALVEVDRAGTTTDAHLVAVWWAVSPIRSQLPDELGYRLTQAMEDRMSAHARQQCRRAIDDLGRWAARVKDAIREGRLRLFAQRIVSLETGESHHEEVLLRMVDEDGGLVAPGAFLPAAERFGLMPALDRWVVSKAIELLRARPERRLFVNLSGTSLGDQTLLSEIEALVGASGLPAGALTFEITETAAIADIAGLQRWARRLKEAGCGFALDDFGTGFSSFAYLQSLPVDLVKIDGSFVRDLDTNATNRALAGAMITVAHALGKTVVAEMVERAPVAEILRALGAEYGQGWYWGRPEPTEPA